MKNSYVYLLFILCNLFLCPKTFSKATATILPTSADSGPQLQCYTRKHEAQTMVMVLSQDIPSDKLIYYRRSLIPAVNPTSYQFGTQQFGSHKYGPPPSELYKNSYAEQLFAAHPFGAELYPHLPRATTTDQMQFARKRMPHIWPRMQSDSPFSPSAAQLKIRKAFKRSCNCFNIQPWSGGAEPDGIGPYSRTWWYDQAGPSGLWYYDYFIQQSWLHMFQNDPPKWCRVSTTLDAQISSGFPDNSYPSQPNIHAVKFGCPIEWKIRAYFGITPKITTSYLHVYITGGSYYDEEGIPTLQAYGVESTTWTEGTLTWNNAPPLKELLYSAVHLSPTWISVPTKGYPTIAFRLANEKCYPLDVPWYATSYAMAAHEHSDQSKRPYWTP